MLSVAAEQGLLPLTTMNSGTVSDLSFIVVLDSFEIFERSVMQQAYMSMAGASPC